MISLGNLYKEPGSDSQDKKRLDLKVYLFFVIVLIILVTVLILLENTEKQKTISEVIPIQGADVPLSAEQVTNERKLLPLYVKENKFIPKGQIDTLNHSTGFSEIVSPKKEENNSNKEFMGPMSDLSQLTKKKISINQLTLPGSSLDSSANVYINNNKTDIKEISIAYANMDTNLTSQERNGILHTIDLKNHYLSIIDGNKIIKINLAPETKVYINNKLISVRDFLLGDIVKISGLGYSNVSELTASTINIEAKLQLGTNTFDL